MLRGGVLGDLPQFVWARPLVGAWLVIDLWAGFSGLCLALLAMGTRFHAVAAENDPIPAQATQQCLSQVVAVDAVENVTGAVLRPILTATNRPGYHSRRRFAVPRQFSTEPRQEGPGRCAEPTTAPTPAYS